MPVTCEYCHSRADEDAKKCASCGAPLARREIDFRDCPHCRRRLLALGSPACNYCGKPLPEKYLKARDRIRQRINEATARGASEEELRALEEGDDSMSRALKSLFHLNVLTRRN